MERPLEGIVVLDLSQFLSGPRCAQLLGLLGARVIKIETPTGDMMRLIMRLIGSERAMSTIQQDKESVVVNWRTPEGAQIIKELTRHADVFVENFAKGILQKSELGYDDLIKENPRLIYASITGFGYTGPRSDKTAFDIIAQATGGIMYAQDQPDRPPGVFFGDLVSGAYAAVGILAALWQRERTGEGKHIDISMQDVMYYHNFWAFADHANGPDRSDIAELLGRDLLSFLTDHEHPMPFWNSYRAKDGYIVIVALTDSQWNRLMHIIGAPELVEDERFGNLVGRIRNADDGIKVISDWVSKKTVAEVEEALSEQRIPCGKVQNFDDLFSDEQLLARGMLTKVEAPGYGEIDVCGFPIKISGTPTQPTSGSPELGQDTDKVLKELLGYNEERILELRKLGAIS